MKIVSDWFRHHFAEPQAVVLILLLVTGTAVIVLLGEMLAPVLAGLVIAYLFYPYLFYSFKAWLGFDQFSD